MKLLFLGYDRSRTKLIAAIEAEGCDVEHTAAPVTDLSNHDLVVWFGYDHGLSPEALQSAKRPVLKLHLSYLPYNKGAHPNFWSFYDGTPQGVSVFEMDGTLDGGPICYQRYVNFAEDEKTFRQTYDRLIAEMETVFSDNIKELLDGSYATRPQRGAGSRHALSDLPEQVSNWDADIEETLALLDQGFQNQHARDMSLVDQIQAVRTRNNVNWMDLLRIALTHAPDETKAVLRQINSDDGSISELLKELGK